MSDDDLARQVRMLRDRQEILDCLNNYCRAVDRFDRDLLLSCYHPDAIDDHGIFYGGPEAFAEWVFTLHGKHQTSTLHHITNHTCELDGDTAHCETYYIFGGMNTTKPPLTVCGGRYIDRFERRDKKWAIAMRMSMLEWQGVPGEVFVQREQVHNERPISARSASDPSYLRPLSARGGKAAYRIIT